MSTNTRRRNVAVAVIVLLLLLLLLLMRPCKPAEPEPVLPPPAAAPAAEPSAAQPSSAPAAAQPEEKLGPATLQAPAEVDAGAAFSVAWTGPDNRGDYVTIVPRAAPDAQYASYRETREANPLELVAPIEAGECEVRYVTGSSRTVLARAPVVVLAVAATLDAAAEAEIGAPLSVTWTGPDGQGDYVTIVPRGAPDERYDNYTATAEGSPLVVVVPGEPGEAEVRYVTGQGRKVLARRPLVIRAPEVSLDAPPQAVAGAAVEVEWTGPGRAGDYVTVVAEGTPDGRYGNYVDAARGSPLSLSMPMEPGPAELRYVSGEGSKVLARRPIEIVAAVITLSAPDEAKAGSDVRIEWSGPDNAGDYITIVEKSAADGRYGKYLDTRRGSPMSVGAPAEPGECEIRYVSGQGGKVLARRPIRVVP